MRTLNVRLVAILLVSMVVFAGAVEGIHRFQVWRKAGFYLLQAENSMREAERAGEQGAGAEELAAYEQAAKSFSWYLHLRPHEPDSASVMERLGLLQADLFRVAHANGPKSTPREREETRMKANGWLREAVGTLEAAMREERGSERTVARRKLIDIYLGSGRFADARAHLATLLEKSPDDGELLEMLGTCEAAVRENDQAAQSFQRAIRSAPDQVSAYRRLAGLLEDQNGLNRPEEADQWMRKMLETNPDSFEAHLAYCGHLLGLTSVNSIDGIRKRPILLDTVVPAALSQAVNQAVQALELADGDPDGRLLAQNTPLLVQGVSEGLKIYNGSLALDDPGVLLLTAGGGAEVDATDAELSQARDEALKALQSEEASADDALSVAAKHGVLVSAMRSALEALRNPNALLRTTRKELLDEALKHALKARELAAGGRDALMSLFLCEFSSDDHEIIRLAEEQGILRESMKRALATEDKNREKEVAPAVLGRTAERALLVDSILKVIKGLELEEGQQQALIEKHGILVDLVRHALRDCESASTNRDLLLQPGRDGGLTQAAKQALAGVHGVLTEALKNVLKMGDASRVSSLNINRKMLADALQHAMETVKLPQQERNILSVETQRGVLVDTLKRALRDPELASADRDELLQEAESRVLDRAVKRSIQAAESYLEVNDGNALLQAARCALAENDYDKARSYADLGIDLYPNKVAVYVMAAEIASRADLPEDALATLQSGLKATNAPELLFRRASFLFARDRIREARVSIRILQKAGYSKPMVGFLQARAEYELEQWLTAVKGRKRELLFTSKSQPQGSLAVGAVPSRLRKEFENRQISLSNDASVAKEDDGRWIVVDRAAVYEVEREGNALKVYREAVLGFERIRGGLAASPSLLKQADFWTGRCYGYLENVDEELKAYRRARDVDPFYLPAIAGLAEALHKAGQFNEALREYRQLIGLGPSSQGGWLPLVQLLLDRNRRLAPSQRNWQEVQRVLDEAEKDVPDSSQLILVRAQVLVAQADEQSLLAKQGGSSPEQQEAAAKAQQLFDDAEKLLLDARDTYPEESGCWIALARLLGHRQEWDRVASLLDEAEQKLGDNVMLRLARATYLADRFGKDATDQLRQLAEDIGQFSEAQRIQLWNGLLSASEEVGDDAQFGKLCRWVAEKQPNNLRIRGTLLELAFRSGDDAGIKETLRDVERIEGKGPLWLYGEAVRLRLLTKEPDDKRLDQALKYLAQAGKLRPSWSRIPLMTAEILDQQGNSKAALESYVQAIDMGEYRPVAIRRTIELLYHQQRFLEAGQLLGFFKNEIPPELLGTAGRIYRKLGRLDLAIEKARQSAAGSQDYRDHIWLGQLLLEERRQAIAKEQTAEAQDAYAEAEKSLQRALELADEIPETWVAMVRFFASTGETQKAEEAIEQARDKIPEDQRSLALAQCYEGMNRPELAQQNYEEALATAPQDPTIARYVADFYLRKGEYPQSNSAERSQAILRAEAILKRIIAGELKGQQEDVFWARRRLALILLARGGYQSGQEALKLIEDNLAVAAASVVDLRYQARILASNPRTREQAAEVLENLPRERRTASPEDRFMLWQLYLAEGDWSRANSQMLDLLAEHANQPVYLAAYIAALLERNETEGCEVWLEKLEGIAPNYYVTVGERAEWLFRRKQYGEALDLMNRFVGNMKAQPADETERSRLVSLALEQFALRLTKSGEDEMAKRFLFDAESLCRKYVRRRPGREVVLVLFLARQGRVEEALSLFEPIWIDSGPIPTAEASLGLLRSPAATEEQIKRIENVVQAALKRFDRPIPLLLVMAQTCAARQRYREAEAYYREVIEKNPEAYQAMNNLAVLLALQGSKLDEALKLITRAIELAGPSASILDSRASVYMAMGQAGKALDDLQKSLAEKATPIRYFHQAQAYQKLRQQQDAVKALKEAQKLGLQAEMLEPLERPAYQKLLKLLK